MQQELSGIWRRIGAIFIDALILGAVGLVLGTFFTRHFVELGGWGRAVGFPIAALYFAIFNSRLGNGQTIGKRLFNIQVVGRDGQPITPAKGFLRYAVIGIPYFLNGAQFPEAVLLSLAAYALSLLVFGVGLSNVYLFVFNRCTRQSLHDLCTGTHVVRPETRRDAALRPVWPVHYMVCGLLLAASLVLPPLGGKMARSDIFSQLRQTRNLIQRQPQVVFATIHDGTSTFRSTGDVKRTTTYITSQVFIRTDAIDDKALAEDIAAIILRSLHDARKRERIQVILTHGYDIGISSFWKRHRHHFTPQQLTGVAGRDV